jgi:hypothetical protein
MPSQRWWQQPRDASIHLLTTEEVAARFRTSPAPVRYWRHIGIGLSGVKVGRRVLYDDAKGDQWWEPKVAATLKGRSGTDAGSLAEIDTSAVTGRSGAASRRRTIPRRRRAPR